MDGVVGVSARSDFVRLAHLRDGRVLGAAATVDHQALAVDAHTPEDLAAQTVGVVLAAAAEAGASVRVGVAYADEAQAAAIDAAMQRQGLSRHLLIPETTAILEALGGDDRLAGLRTVVLYDLGAAGLTVSVADLPTRTILASERCTALRGGVSRETCAAALTDSVDLVGDLSEHAGALPEAVVVLGCGAHRPDVRAVLERHSAVPVVVATDPEYTAATGAARLAHRGGRPVTAAAHEPSTGPSDRGGPRRQVTAARLAGATLAALAVAALLLGFGRDLFGSQMEASTDTGTTSRTTPSPTPSSDVLVHPVAHPTGP